jgi:hypothetical protein
MCCVCVGTEGAIAVGEWYGAADSPVMLHVPGMSVCFNALACTLQLVFVSDDNDSSVIAVHELRLVLLNVDEP